MNRRQILRGSGALLATGLAGCLGLQGSTSTDEKPACPTTIPRPVRSASQDDTRIVCNDGTDEGSDDETRLVPDPRSASLPDASLEFTLTNRRDDHFNTNFYLWSLNKRVDGEWYMTTGAVYPGAAESSLGPDASHAWTVTVDNTELQRVVDSPEDRDDVTVRAHGAGTYAFLISGSYGKAGERPPTNSPQIGYAAQFTLEGDDLPLKPTEAVTDVSRDGDTVVVVRRGVDDPSRVITLERTDEASDRHRTLITEQLYGRPVIRDALAHADPDADRIRIESPADTTSEVRGWGSLEYRDEIYSVTAGPP